MSIWWRAMILLGLCTCALASAPSYSSQTSQSDEARVVLLARWAEWIELDMPADVVREGREHVEGQGALATDGEALSLFARALSQTGGREAAYALLRNAKPSEATQASVEIALARLELEDDQLPAVVRRLASPDPKTPVRYPEYGDAWILLGKARSRLGDAQAATPLLQTFVTNWRLHPEAPSAWHLLAQDALARRDVEQAKTYREQGQNLATWHAFYKARRIQIRSAPNDPLPRFGLAQLWTTVNELQRAREEVARVFALDRGYARAWALLAEIERKEEHAAQATAAYDRALELDPELTDARFNRALLALARKDDSAARADLEHIVNGAEAAEERYLGAHLALARLLERANDAEGARQRYARYQQLGGTEEM